MSSLAPQDLNTIISNTSNPSTCSRVQKYAYLLGASSEMLELTQEEINQHRAVQSCYEAMSGIDPALLDSRASSPAGEIFPFQIPINTTKAGTPTTTVEVTFTDDNIHNDIFSRICAYMDDVDSAFKEAAEARNSGKKKKRVVIEIVNTDPAISKKSSKRK
ncbi:hypothetical protein BJV74DRAFT_953469 [Russula compacta]|nr:hypothetical protein BJV74DRAFT_953469 [Russula compacta]